MVPPSSENSPAAATTQAKARVACHGCARRELDRLLESPSLRDSDQLKRFLRYVVDHTLAGEGDQLKEYRLGVEVFDRGPSFDPKLDPVVRMAARRLRAKLQEHYENDGQSDPVRIEVPKGGYAATLVEFLKDGEVCGNAQPEVEPKIQELATAAADRRTWKLATGAVLVIVALVAAGLYYRSHEQATRLTDRDTIVLADFANSTGDPVFDDTLKTALNISLQQSPFLNPLPESKLTDTLQQMTLPADAKLTAEVTRELCQRAGSKAYVVGAIGSLGSEYVLGLKAANCHTGDVLVQEQVTASSKEEVLNALGHAASKLRNELGESLAMVRMYDVPLVEATTSSLDALKVFSIGQKVYREKGPEGSLPYNLQAVAIDPNFALAYFLAGADYHSLYQVARARDFISRAFQLRDRVSRRERLAIEAYYYRNLTGELEKAIETDQEEIQDYPRELYGYIRLGIDYATLGQWEKAKRATLQAIQIAPDHSVPVGNLTSFEMALQHFDENRRIIQDAQHRKLDNLQFHTTLYTLGFLASDSSAMEQQESWFSNSPDEAIGLALRSDTASSVGQVARADQLTERALRSAIHGDSKETGAVWQENNALRDAAYAYSTKANREAKSGLELSPDSLGVQVEAALAFAMTGDKVRAEEMNQKLNRLYPVDTQIQSVWLPTIQAQLALNQGDPGTALNRLQGASTVEFGLVPFVNNLSCLYSVFVRGEAYLKTNQGTAAAAEFQKILDHSGIVWNCWTGALAHLGVARANALQAKTSQGADADAARVRALAAYKDFLTLWKDADPDIPILKEAKAEYAKLQ